MKRQTKAYREYLLSDAWLERKERIIRTRGRKCERCGAVGPLDLHHKTYDRLGQERDADLQLLCRGCHQVADRYRAANARYYNARSTYIRKKYGDHPPSNVEDEFDDWLRKKEKREY